jgi:hypothetical protein
MILRRQFLTVPAGMPVPDGTPVELRLHATNSIIATAETQGGWAEFLTIGNPGPHYVKTTYQGDVTIASSRSTGVSGATDIGNLPLFVRTFHDGYVDGLLSMLKVTGGTGSLAVTVGSGAAYVQGVLYDQYQALSVAIDGPSSQPRIDLLVVEIVPADADPTLAGRSRVRLKKGTPATSPAVPGLTRTASLYEWPLAEVRVEPGVSAIAVDKVTDRRTVASPRIPVGAITEPMLANAAKPGVRVQQGGTVITNHARMLSFDIRDFIATKGAGADYSSAAHPYVTLTIDRTKLLAWLKTELAPTAPAPADPPPVGGSGPFVVQSVDGNFNATGTWTGGFGAINGASASVTLPAGKWYIETILNMTLRGSGSSLSQCTIQLTGNATPQGTAKSQRMFPVAGNTYNSITLSGRRELSLSVATKVVATVERTHVSGPAVDFRDGVVYIKAFRI